MKRKKSPITSDDPTLFDAGALPLQNSNHKQVISAPYPETHLRVVDDQIANSLAMLRLLDHGAYELQELYAIADRVGLFDRDNGRGVRKQGAHIGQHRVRSALDWMRRTGEASRAERSIWLLEGERQRPTAAIFVLAGEPSEITLMLGDAKRIASQIDEPVDFIFCDPPWQLDFGGKTDATSRGDRYGRDASILVPGYVDLAHGQNYLEFSEEWIATAAPVLRPGGMMGVITAPQLSSAIQHASEKSGLIFRNRLIVPRASGIAHGRHRYATSHAEITVMGRGPITRTNTTFHLGHQSFDSNGTPFPIDILSTYSYDRRGKLRYPNQLALDLVREMVLTYTNRGDFVVDFFNGSGTTPLVCLFTGRRCLSGDINPDALLFTMARLLDASDRGWSTLMSQRQPMPISKQPFLDLE